MRLTASGDLLPADAREWSELDVRRAFVHELEHIRRGDWTVHILARAVCALYWFHPLGLGCMAGSSVSKLSVPATMPSFWAQNALTMQSN